MLFLLHFLKNFSFSLKVYVYELLTNFIGFLLFFAQMVFMLLISFSQIMVDQAVQLPSHKLQLSSHLLGFDDCIFNLLGLSFFLSFTRKLDAFRNEISVTASDLIPADVNQVKGERFSAIKATANGDCLFNSSSILLHGNESLAL